MRWNGPRIQEDSKSTAIGVTLGFIGDFIESDFFNNWLLPFLVIIIFIWLISYLLFRKAPGILVQEILGNRPIKFEDIDAEVHSRIVDTCKKTCKFSDDPTIKYLYIRSSDDIHYTQAGGKHYVGKVIGFARGQTSIMVMFKEHFWSYRKYFLVAPPDLLLSPSSARNVIIEGTQIKNLDPGDFFYPIPSQGFKGWDENKMDWWAIWDFYETRRIQTSLMMYTQMGETTGLLAASSSAQERMFKDSLKVAKFRREAAPIDEPQTTQESSSSFLE